MISIAHQDRQQLGGTLSVLTRQKKDHARLEELLREIERPSSWESQERALNRTARLVFAHAFAEEAVLWPALRRDAAYEQGLTLDVEQEHQEVNELWDTLEQLAPDDPRRDGILRRLLDLLRQDVRDEEDQLLPRLQQMLDTRRLQVLGIAWELVRRTAPTRPHTLVARRPPGNLLAAAPLSVIDRLRDALDAIALRSRRLHPLARVGSQRLGHLAAVVERFPLFQRGEHPSTRLARR